MGNTKKYIIGQKQAPEWLRNRLMMYRKFDGSTGYEIYCNGRAYDLIKGDRVMKLKNGKFKIIPTKRK